MLNKVKRLMTSLRRNMSGNVMLIVAAGAPALIGGAGLAVDTAQWYMWKREMQYAVDQAAMAGAWSRVGGTTGTEYMTRAQQEITANLQVVNFQGTPSITLADYKGQAKNSVLVSLSATRELPFSRLLMKSGTTITVSAQAAFEKASTFTACLIAVAPTTSGAIRFRGNAYILAKCGVAALSTSGTAIIQNGQGTFNVGYLVAAGGIDASLEFDKDGNHVNDLFSGQQGLVDPFGSLTPPTNPTPRTFSCATISTYLASYTNRTLIEDWTYTATTVNGLATATPTKKTVTDSPQNGTETATAATVVNDPKKNPATAQVTTAAGPNQTIAGQPVQTTTCTGTGSRRVCTTTTGPGPSTYKRVDRVTTFTHTITKVDVTTTRPPMEPGTYIGFEVTCDTKMNPGVYVMNGGKFTVRSQDQLIGQGIMIVLKNGASIDINGGATLDLRAMSTIEMVAAGISTEEALKLKDMLIFEDRNSNGAGSQGDKFNGGAGAKMEGTIYLPKSDVNFAGNFSVTSRCLVIAAYTIDIGGTANMTSFCPNGGTNTGVSVGGGSTTVRLVA